MRSLFAAFSTEPSESCNQQFNSINDFNEVNATPLISITADEVIVFNLAALAEAIYVSPFTG